MSKRPPPEDRRGVLERMLDGVHRRSIRVHPEPEEQTLEPTLEQRLEAALQPSFTKDMPTALSNPAFTEELVGVDALAEICDVVMRRGGVVGGFRAKHMIESNGDPARVWELSAATSPHKFAGWVAEAERGNPRRLMAGAYNEVLAIDSLPRIFAYSVGRSEMPPLVLRRMKPGAKKIPTLLSVAEEAVLSCYAHAAGVGPAVYAVGWTVPGYKPTDRPFPWGERVGSSAMFAERWDGDVFDFLEAVPPMQFARLFSELLGKAADAGLFHSDLKPENMLYREEGGRLVITMTDFDPDFVTIVSHAQRVGYRACCILAHAALVMGAISCANRAQWQKFVGPVRARLVADHSVDAVDVDTVCGFLGMRLAHRPVDGGLTTLDEVRAFGSDRRVREGIGRNFRHTLRHYVQLNAKRPIGPESRCLLYDHRPQPLFSEFVRFALDRNDAEAEEWARQTGGGSPQRGHAATPV